MPAAARTATAATAGAKRAIVAAMSSPSRWLRRNHVVARMTSRPASISSPASASSATSLSSASTACQNGTSANDSRASRYARTTSAGEALVASIIRWTKVLPTRLIMLLTTCVAMISRFSGCFAM